MPLAKTALQRELTSSAQSTPAADTVQQFPSRLPNVRAGGELANTPRRSVSPLTPPSRQPSSTFLPRAPVVTGEATYRGYLPVDGIITGQLTASGGVLTVKQRSRNTRLESTPELDGEISFRDMLRVNGHIAGRVSSEKGTLIIDAAAQVDADIDVGVAVVAGTVNGDVIARERVELGLGAVINGNISTPLLSIKPGATFHGDCRMLKGEAVSS
jgi:cytoskeletal protein CcmA (bactofilin family)